MLMMLSSGFPKLIVLTEFAGVNEEEVNKQCLKLQSKIKRFQIKNSYYRESEQANKYWDIRRESFALLRKHIKVNECACLLTMSLYGQNFCPKFLPELNEILNKYDLTYTIAGHAGDGNFHIIPLMDFLVRYSKNHHGSL